jgi:hypothetical protein
MEDKLKIIKVYYLSKHLLDHSQNLQYLEMKMTANGR